MKQYGNLRAIFMSFYSRDLYRDVANNWGAGVIFYLLLLLVICWIALMFKIQPSINLFTTQLANNLTPQLPAIMVIKEGVLSTPEKRPYLIKNTDGSDKAAAIVDTSGRYKNLQDAKVDVLVTQEGVYYNDSHNIQQMKKFPETLTVNIYPVKVGVVITKIFSYSWILLFPLLVILSFFYRIVQSILYAIIGKIYAAISGTALSYYRILKLTMVAITPAIVIGTVLEFMDRWGEYNLVLFIISLIYVIFAVSSNKGTP